MTRFKGFTLIELMVVIALVAIIATIAVPSFGVLIADNRAESQAEELNSLLQYARSEAVIRKVSTTATIDASTGVIKIYENPINTDKPLRASTLSASNVSFEANANNVSYRPNGTSNPPNFSALFCSGNDASTGRLLTVSGSGVTKLHHKGKSADGGALGSCSL